MFFAQKVELMAYEKNFQDKVLEIENRYHNQIHNLMAQNTELRYVSATHQCIVVPTWNITHKLFNSLAPGRSGCDSKNGIFSLVLIGIFRSSHDNALWLMPQDLTDDKSTLVQVMALCCQGTSHYLSQCWLSSLSPYGVARPQWVIKVPVTKSCDAEFVLGNIANILPFSIISQHWNGTGS